MSVQLIHRWGAVTILPERRADALAAILANPDLAHERPDWFGGVKQTLPCTTLSEAFCENSGLTIESAESESFEISELPETYHRSLPVLLATLAPFISDGELVVEIEGDVYRWSFADGVMRETLGEIVFAGEGEIVESCEAAE